MAIQWLQKLWWKIKTPAPSVPFEELVAKPYIDFQGILSRGQEDLRARPLDTRSIATQNNLNNESEIYAHVAKEVIAYDKRFWLGKLWIGRAARSDIEHKRLWCATQRCQPLKAQVIQPISPLITASRSLTSEKINLMQELIKPTRQATEQPALPTSWRNAIKKIVHGWNYVGHSVIERITQQTNTNNPQRAEPIDNNNANHHSSTTALIVSNVSGLANENPKAYKKLLSNFISACGFYGLDVLQATSRQVSGLIRKSIVTLHTDKAEKEGLGVNGERVIYTENANANYHMHRTELLTELKERFDIAGLPLEKKLFPNTMFNMKDILDLYKEGQIFKYYLEQKMKIDKDKVCLRSEVDILSQNIRETALNLNKQIDQRYEEYDKKIDQRYEGYDKKIDQRYEEYDKKLDELSEKNKQLKPELEEKLQRILTIITACVSVPPIPEQVNKVTDTTQAPSSPRLFKQTQQPATQKDTTPTPNPGNLKLA